MPVEPPHHGPSGLAAISARADRTLLACLGLCIHGALLLLFDTLSDHALDLFLSAPIAASQMLVLFAPANTLGRPWNVVAGHMLSALAAFCLAALMPAPQVLLSAALVIPLSALVMGATRSLHPPATITASLLVLPHGRPFTCAALGSLGFASLTLVLVRGLLDLAIERRRSAVRSRNPRTLGPKTRDTP